MGRGTLRVTRDAGYEKISGRVTRDELSPVPRPPSPVPPQSLIPHPYSFILDLMFDQLKFDSSGLIPAIVQEKSTGMVLMLAYMNQESLEETIRTGKTCFWSRSRQELWRKGKTSGNIQKVREIRYDCDGDALLLIVDQKGPACHTGEKSCFYRSIEFEKC